MQENLHVQVTIGFGFTSDWLRKWGEFLQPITKRSNVKPKQTQNTFDTQLKIALNTYESQQPMLPSINIMLLGVTTAPLNLD